MADTGPTLDDLRGEIDRLDDQLLDLLARRADIAAAIAPLKAALGAPLLRPGREADVLRRLIAKQRGGFDALTLIRIWREIMSAALRQQGDFSVVVSAPEGAPSCWALARGQYGAATRMSDAPGPSQAISVVAAGQHSVAIVPYPGVEEPDPWWARLMGESAPRVVARLPVTDGLAPEAGCADGLAIAAMTPEPSGDDNSLIAIETTESLSRAAIARAFTAAGLEVSFTASKGAGGRMHLADVAGFVAPSDTSLDKLVEALGDTVHEVTAIGAYAVPLRLPPARGGA
jgi:chorismate mutase/prephenate dehydratase